MMTLTKSSLLRQCFSKMDLTAGRGYLQCRMFSHTSIRPAKPLSQTFAMSKQPPQKSLRAQSMDMSRTELPQDLGLLPGTFIKPPLVQMPAWLFLPRERLRMEWIWLKTKVQNLWSVLIYSRYYNKGLPLRFKERRQVAKEIHKEMCSAFASGDQDTLRKICCTGLANTLMTRIAKRADNERVTWTLDRYIRSPSTLFTGVHVISDRATIIPDLPKSGIRQVIVLITSIQTSETGKMRHKRGLQGNLTYVVDDSTLKRKQQTCSEYLVIQKQMWRGKEEPWRIWGHTQPTTLDDLDSPMFAMHNASLTMSERLEQMKAMIERR